MKNVAEQIKSILADRSLNAYQRWTQALAMDIERKHGAPEAREIQNRIKSQWSNAKKKARPQPTYFFGNGHKWRSHEYRLEQFENRLKNNQANHQRLMDDAVNGYPKTLLSWDLWSQSWLNQTDISDLIGGNNHQYARIGGWIVSSNENISWDNNYYSKSWHRAHGGKKNVDSRIVMIRRFHNGEIENRDISVDSWRGQWAIKALVDSGVIEPVKVPIALNPVQLNTAFDVRLIRTIIGLSIYERTLAGEHYDYCALTGNQTYHAESIRRCIKGLHKKLTAIEIKKNSPINWELCKSLGFCDTGIKEFCSDFGLNPKGNYSPSQIEKSVKNNLAMAAKYETELRKVAQTLNYHTSI